MNYGVETFTCDRCYKQKTIKTGLLRIVSGFPMDWINVHIANNQLVFCSTKCVRKWFKKNA